MNNATAFGKPQRTSHAVFVPIDTPRGTSRTSRVRLLFNDISHISIRPSARTPGGFALTARFPANTWAGEQLEVLDAESLAATLTNNKAWFKNGLTEEQIHEFFEPSLEVGQGPTAKATFHISPTHPAMFTDTAGKPTTLDAFFEQWSLAPHRGQQAVLAHATIDVVGILFEKQRFRLRLMLRALEAHGPPPPSAAIDLIPDRRELEDHWRAEVDAVLTPKIAAQEARLEELRSLKQDLHRQIDAAERTQDGPTWDAHLAAVAQTLRPLHDSDGNILHRI